MDWVSTLGSVHRRPTLRAEGLAMTWGIVVCALNVLLFLTVSR
jgi:hypothetical protein